jgi:chromate transport protein ChrA
MTEPTAAADGTSGGERDSSPDDSAPRASASDAPAPAPEPEPTTRSWMALESRSRRLLIGAAIYLVCLIVFAIVASDRLATHTPYNHFAHLADAWLHGRHDLRGGPPGYAMNNDFAVYEGKTFISFPPFPALLMMPLVWIAGSPENFRDAQFIIWLAGVGPAVLFLVLEKMRRTGRSARTELENVFLAVLFAFGTVYFFSAVQGTVWFAAHVVGVGLTALFVLCALDAERPLLAGLLLGCMFLTRTTTLLLGTFFVFELIRASYIKRSKGAALPSEGTLWNRIAKTLAGTDRRALLVTGALFAIPLLLCLGIAARMNYERFHDPRPWAFGHEYLTVGWQGRIRRWGLFSYHFLPRNLGVMLASLPWRPAPNEAFGAFPGPLGDLLRSVLHREVSVPFQISGHGIALWFTTPFYLWLLRPKQATYLSWAAFFGLLGPLVMNLLYQNSGWFQFGYRFSNDYAILLFVMLAIGVPRFGRAFKLAAVWAIAWNLFGAATFERQIYGAFYSHDSGAVFPQD